MKKLTSKDPITFRVNGSTVLEINSAGVLAKDSDAEIVKDRLGDQITVEDVTLKEAAKEATTNSDEKEEATVPQEPTEEEAPKRGRKSNK